MDRHNRDLLQIQFLILQMERQLVIITAMIDRLRRRWGLRRGQRRQRRYWVRPWLSQAECEEEGEYSRLKLTLELDDPMAYRNFIRKPPELFQELEQRLGPEIQRGRTWMKDPLSPELKLAVTLRHLACGDSYPTLQFAFRVARLTINKFVPEVCNAIISPTSPEDWSEVEHPTCPGCPGWKAHSHQMSTTGWQPLPQLQGLPFDSNPGLGGWRLQIPVGRLGGSRVKL